MRVEVIFLGTGSLAPTRDRNVQSIALIYQGQIVLIDCGEGTLRQMAAAGLSYSRVAAILITHWHWDHVGGLPGLLQVISDAGRASSVLLYGPSGTRDKISHLRQAVDGAAASWPLDIRELAPSPSEVISFHAMPDYTLQAAAMDHGCPAVAYAWAGKEQYRLDEHEAARLGLRPGPQIGELLRRGQVQVSGRTILREECSIPEAGVRIAVVADTRPNPSIALLAAQADLLICEATYAGSHSDLARARHHMTAKDAATAAHVAQPKRLILTHFSSRYPDPAPLVEEARAIFPNVEPAIDLLRVSVGG